jgi:hypothetical protein
VNIETGKTVGFLRFEGGVQEIFAVQILRGIRFPELLEWSDQHLGNSYVLPDDALAEVVLPTEAEQLPSPAPIGRLEETPSSEKHESRNPKFETNPNNQMAQSSK